MTSQTKYYVELSDILAVRCECKHCHATVSLPFGRDVRTEGLYSCPSCNEPWTKVGLGENQSIDSSIRTFMDSVNKFREVLQRTDELRGKGGFVLSLEVHTETDSNTSASAHA